MSKIIEDIFQVTIGSSDPDAPYGEFLCGERREGAELEEPFDAHSVERWIIRTFRLKPYSKHRIKVTVELIVGEG